MADEPVAGTRAAGGRARTASRARAPRSTVCLPAAGAGCPLPGTAAGRSALATGNARPAISPALRRLKKAVQAMKRRMDRDRHRAPALRERLLAAAPAERAELLAGNRRFASPGLAERLLAAAAAAARNRPAAALESCDLALAVVARLDAERLGAGPVVSLRAAAAIRRAEALWWARDCAHAEAVLGAALADLDATPIGAPERGLYCRVAALLRAGQGRLDEALALLTRAAQIYRDQENPAELAACLIDRGWLLAGEDPRSACLPLWTALEVEGAPDLWLSVRAAHCMALCLTELGLVSEVEPLLRQARSLAAELEDETDRLRCLWTEAQIESRRGRGEQVMAALPAVIEGWLVRGEGHLAALAVLDLAEVYLDRDRSQGLAELDRLGRRLGTAGLDPDSALALRAVLALALRNPLAARCPLAHLHAHLWRARHQPGLAYVPCRAPAHHVSWGELPFEPRAEICVSAGLEPETAALPVSAVPADVRKLITWTHQEATGKRIEWDLCDELRATLHRLADGLRRTQTDLRMLADSIPFPDPFHNLDARLSGLIGSLDGAADLDLAP